MVFLYLEKIYLIKLYLKLTDSINLPYIPSIDDEDDVVNLPYAPSFDEDDVVNLPYAPSFDDEDDVVNLPYEINIETEFDKNIHLRIYKRNARKCLTTVNLEDYSNLTEKNIKKLLKKIKRKFACGGSYNADTQILSFNGDIREDLANFLIDIELVKKIM